MKSWARSLLLLSTLLVASSLCSGDFVDDLLRVRSQTNHLAESSSRFFSSKPRGSSPVPAPVPEQFASFDYSYITEIGANAPLKMTGVFLSDAIYRRQASFLTTGPLPPPVSSPFIFNSWNDALNNSSYIETNGVCRVSPITEGFFGFTWLLYSKLINPNDSVGGVSCETWQLVVQQDDNSVALDLCLIPRGSWSQPVQLNATISTPTINETLIESFGGFQQMRFEGDSKFFDLPKQCYSDGIVCPEGPVQTLSLYNYHVGSYLDIGNQNLATSIGEAYYLCSQLLGRRPPAGSDTYVSLWAIDVNTTWGLYEQCNPIGPGGAWMCTGGNPSLVGRESPDAIYGTEGGQCLSDEDLENVGIWYSFNNASRCDPRSGQPGCQWSPAKLLRTVDQNCLMAQGLLQACQQDNWFPFNRSSTLLESVLTSSVNPCQ